MRLLPVVLGMLVLGMACGGSSEPAAPPPATTTTTVTTTTTTTPPPPPPAPPATYATKSFVCCTASRIDDLVNEYLDVTHALEGTEKNLDGQITALNGVAKGALGKVDAASDAQLNTVVSITQQMLASKDMTVRRGLYKQLTASVLSLAKTHAGGTKYRLAEVYCSGFDGAWITESETLANPYGAPSTACAVYR